jgi:hypothetical protein
MTRNFSKEEEISQVKMFRPHVVILGAGASIAAFPNGDKNGLRLPSMMNFVEILGLGSVLKAAEIEYINRNFEDVYDEIYQRPNCVDLRLEIENTVYNYFSSMELFYTPTLYDYLILSLRKKDVIATFNWDPFLLSAYVRNQRYFEVASLPTLLFLHGNVMKGACKEHKSVGLNGRECSTCGKRFEPSKLLYPIKQKNYLEDFIIGAEWRILQAYMSQAFMLTVFGYSAPTSDVEAVSLMKKAWGDSASKSMEQTEIIDIKDQTELRETWNPFIFGHHYETHNNFYDSWIANHPRRTGEAYLNQYVDVLYLEGNPVPKDLDFPELWNWFGKLAIEEDRQLKN